MNRLNKKLQKHFIFKDKKKISPVTKNKNLSLVSKELFNSIEWNKLQSYNKDIYNIQMIILNMLRKINLNMKLLK